MHAGTRTNRPRSRSGAIFTRAGASSRRRGAAMIEFALVLPIFVALMFGILEFGRAFMVQQIITNGAREGARLAILAGSTEASVHGAVDTYLSSNAISGHTRVVSPDPATVSTGDPITMTVSVPFSAVDWGLVGYFADNTLEATVTMRKE